MTAVAVEAGKTLVDAVYGDGIAPIDVEVYIVAGDAGPVVEVKAYHQPTGTMSVCQLPLEVAGLLGETVRRFDPRGAKMFGTLLVTAVEQATGQL